MVCVQRINIKRINIKRININWYGDANGTLGIIAPAGCLYLSDGGATGAARSPAQSIMQGR